MQEIRKPLALFSRPMLSKASAICITLGATTSTAASPALTAFNIQNKFETKTNEKEKQNEIYLDVKTVRLKESLRTS